MDSCSGGRLKTFICPHCERKVGKIAFFRHKRAHYDLKNMYWQKEEAIKASNTESGSEYQSGNHSIEHLMIGSTFTLIRTGEYMTRTVLLDKHVEAGSCWYILPVLPQLQYMLVT